MADQQPSPAFLCPQEHLYYYHLKIYIFLNNDKTEYSKKKFGQILQIILRAGEQHRLCVYVQMQKYK